MNQLSTGFTLLIQEILFILPLLIMQTSQQLFELDQNAQQISLNSKWYPVDSYVGILFNYCPLSEISHIGSIQRSQTYSYLLNLGYEKTTEQLLFIHYVQFQPVTRKISHIIKLKIKNQIMVEEFVFDSNHYEGYWYLQYMYYDIYQKNIILGFMQGEQKIERSLSSLNFFDQEIKFILGGSLKKFEPAFQEEFRLSSFPGKMSFIFLESNNKKQFYLTNLKSCESNSRIFVNEIYDFSTQPIQLQVDQEYDTEFQIQFWVKIDDVFGKFKSIQVIRSLVMYCHSNNNLLTVQKIYDIYSIQNRFGKSFVLQKYSIVIILIFLNFLFG